MIANNGKCIVMVCTAARGGMRSVVEGYLSDGLFSRWNIKLIDSHVEGNIILRLATAVKALFQLITLLAKKKVALVHCHSAMRSSFWRKSVFSLISRAVRVPVIFHLHGSEMKAFIDGQPMIVRRLIAWILKKQSVVIVLSKSWKSYINAISPNANVVILTNYIELPVLPTEDEKSVGGNIELLFLGYVGHRKGVYDLLPAIQKALIQIPNLRLTIGGNGEIIQSEAMSEELNVNKSVEFCGWVLGEQKNMLLQRSHIYVLPSYNEGLPVSLLEAMSWQLPVITTNVGGIPELVRDGIDGYLIEPGDIDGLSSAIIRLSKDVNIRKKMGESARQQIEHRFAKEKVLPKLESLYQSMVA